MYTRGLFVLENWVLLKGTNLATTLYLTRWIYPLFLIFPCSINFVLLKSHKIKGVSISKQILYTCWFTWHYYTTKLLLVISLWLNFHIRENLWVERERLQVELWWCWWGVKGAGGGSYFIYLDKGKPLDVPFCIREKDEQTGLGRKTAFIC